MNLQIQEIQQTPSRMNLGLLIKTHCNQSRKTKGDLENIMKELTHQVQKVLDKTVDFH